jgi:hypothetical protein
MLLYCVSRPTERGSDRSCSVDDLYQVAPAGTISLKQQLYTAQPASSWRSLVGQIVARIAKVAFK